METHLTTLQKEIETITKNPTRSFRKETLIEKLTTGRRCISEFEKAILLNKDWKSSHVETTRKKLLDAYATLQKLVEERLNKIEKVTMAAAKFDLAMAIKAIDAFSREAHKKPTRQK